MPAAPRKGELSMEIKEYQAAIEAVLFASGEPVAATRLAEVLELDLETAVRLADDWLQDVNTRGGGLLAVRLGDKYQLCTNKTYAGYVRRAMDIRRNTPLSQAAMEVLAIVAYNQPVTRAFVEQIRGVDSSSAVNSLVVRDLVEEAGRLELPGRPIAYRTTANFLRCFGLQSLDDLPDITAAAQAQEQLEQLSLTPADGQGEEP